MVKMKGFFKRNSSTVLTCLGGVGVVATSVLAVKETPKALRLLNQAEEEKGCELTTWDKIKVAAPAYIPAALVGISTITCIFGANALNKRNQASLMSAYALLDNSFKQYKAKVEELYGEEADMCIREEIAKDNYDENLYPAEDDTLLFYDEYSKQYFNAKMEDVIRAEYLLNRNLTFHGHACLNEFYALLKLPQQPYGEILGWHYDAIYEIQWFSWVEFNHRKIELEDGMECYILEIQTEPIPNFEDY